MTTLKVQVTTEDKNITVEVPNPTEAQKTLALTNAFTFAGSDQIIAVEEVHAPQAPATIEKPITPVGQFSPEKQKKDIALATAMKEHFANMPDDGYIDHVPHPADTEEEPTAMALAILKATSQVKEEQPEQPYYELGYKVRESGRKDYRCRYICPECGHKGNHYIPDVVTNVNCHKCETSMPVHKATIGKGSDRDRFGNFYVAGHQMPQVVIK